MMLSLFVVKSKPPTERLIIRNWLLNSSSICFSCNKRSRSFNVLFVQEMHLRICGFDVTVQIVEILSMATRHCIFRISTGECQLVENLSWKKKCELFKMCLNNIYLAFYKKIRLEVIFLNRLQNIT